MTTGSNVELRFKVGDQVRDQWGDAMVVIGVHPTTGKIWAKYSNGDDSKVIEADKVSAMPTVVDRSFVQLDADKLTVGRWESDGGCRTPGLSGRHVGDLVLWSDGEVTPSNPSTPRSTRTARRRDRGSRGIRASCWDDVLPCAAHCQPGLWCAAGRDDDSVSGVFRAVCRASLLEV